jgi:hypothetical protein
MPQWQLAELAVDVGELLGMSLDLTWWGPGVRIGAEGDGLHLAERPGKPGYVEVSGWFPRTSYYFRKGERGHITVRINRGPTVIAAEIGRRLMPAYRAAVASVTQHDAAEQAAQTARDQLAGYICGLFPAKATAMPAHCQTGARAEVIVYLPGHQGGYVRISHDGQEAELERFRVPASVALRMLETAAFMTHFDTGE